jgi:hypothetical protein
MEMVMAEILDIVSSQRKHISEAELASIFMSNRNFDLLFLTKPSEKFFSCSLFYLNMEAKPASETLHDF